MSATSWITIAGIAVPFITSWSQFLFKEQWEKKKALATASATNQPKASVTDRSRQFSQLRESFSVSVPRIWFLATYLTAGWLSLYVTFNIATDVFHKGFQLTLRSLFTLLLGVSALASSHVMFWRSTRVHELK